ncbi:MAG: Unknown protein [uncultured Sulfurovum sp.]|uniref:Lycopene cyclase domain-containing protein n=1 Tax=uncultured Sulfurovum sp. TaxID=269237 RepID=A0A6S6TT85_9BACT|nr:MAG: Unknown protein [uncultured Sulfurovum sp.]
MLKGLPVDNLGYISISALIFPIWLYIYLKAKWLRLRMRNIGIYIGILAAIFEPFFMMDYWNPPSLFNINNFYFIEDFFFGFLSAGIAISIYNFIFSIKYVKIYKRRKNFSLILSLSIVISFLLLNQVFEYNSVFAFCLSTTSAILIIFIIRKDLILPALYSSFFSIIIIISSYMIIFNIFLPSYWESYWKLVDTPYEQYIFGIPWTEYLYYLSMQSYLSVIYDFASGTAKIKITRD